MTLGGGSRTRSPRTRKEARVRFPLLGELLMARCLRAAGVRHMAVAEENAAEAALVDSPR